MLELNAQGFLQWAEQKTPSTEAERVLMVGHIGRRSNFLGGGGGVVRPGCHGSRPALEGVRRVVDACLHVCGTRPDRLG